MELGFLLKKSSFKIGILLALVFAIGAGPLVHDHEQSLSMLEKPVHHEGHSHDDEGSIGGKDLASPKINFSSMGHTHLPPSFDHIHDTWLLHAGLTARYPDFYSLHFVASSTTVRQTADLLIEKPPKPLRKI